MTYAILKFAISVPVLVAVPGISVMAILGSCDTMTRL